MGETETVKRVPSAGSDLLGASFSGTEALGWVIGTLRARSRGWCYTSSQASSRGDGASKGDFVGVFKITPSGEAAGGSRDADAEWHQESMQVGRGRLTREIEVGGDDHLGRSFLFDTREQFGNAQLVGPDPLDRRE